MMRIFDQRGFFDSSFVLFITIVASWAVAFGLGLGAQRSFALVVHLLLIALPAVWFGLVIGAMCPRRSSAHELRPTPEPRRRPVEEPRQRIDVQA